MSNRAYRLSLAVVAVSALLVAPVPAQDEQVWYHASAFIGEPKYGPDFEMFDYVNPDAPKGGEVRLSETGGFDTFNPILPQGETAAGLGLVFESLTTQNMDEISTQYGLLAESWTYPDDYSSVTFRLDPDARWHDGEPLTPEDVVWSFEKLVEVNPDRAEYYENVTGVAVTGEHEITFTFDTAGNRELPLIIGQIAVLPKHWWEAEGPNGEPRDVGRSTLEPPMGSGPYRLETFSAGRSVTFARVEDYWGAGKPVNVGHYNFDRIKYEYFLDRTVQFEAFKADEFDWWLENVARRWATAYDFPAVERGDIVLERFENPYRDSGIMVGFIPNLRREKFQDPLVREALNYAFDFEELQETVFYGEYERIDSYFYRTELASGGLPEGEELDILNSVSELIPESVFTEEYTNPVGGSPEALRGNLRVALDLFNQAGYTLDGNSLVDENGDQFSFEILLTGPTIEPVALSWEENLEQIGVDVSVRSVDASQYINRVRSRDFDVTYQGWAQALSPGNEQRFFFGSQAAGEPNSSNYAGIADEGVDALIDKVIFADDRETLVAATKALDRVLLHHHYVVPSYTAIDARIAHWDRFSRPSELPEFAIGFPSIWWYDANKAAMLE